MTKVKAGNNSFLKELNQKGLLDLIRIHKSISRVELSEITGLSPTAAGTIVNGLIKAGYIHETSIGESKGGRRPVMLELNPDSLYTIGVDIDVDYLNVVLMDISGSIKDEKIEKMSQTREFSETVKHLESLISGVLQKNSIKADRLIGIGISVPGLVNNHSGEVILAPNLEWESKNICDALTAFPETPIYLENEAKASAVSENWLGACRDTNDFICINVKSGIGAGIFTGGRLYSGATGTAGEVGHIVVDENGPKCGCGNYGCLETLASTSRIVEKAKKLVRQGIVSKLNELSDLEEINLDFIIAAAASGDEASINILAEAARYLGIAISYIVNTLNPAKIVIGKEFVKYSTLVMDKVKEIVAGKALKLPASGVEIVTSELGERSSVLGAAIIPLKVLFGR